jgi:hypothetical protein
MSLDERKERLERIEIENLVSEEEPTEAQTEGGATDQRTQ